MVAEELVSGPAAQFTFQGLICGGLICSVPGPRGHVRTHFQCSGTGQEPHRCSLDIGSPPPKLSSRLWSPPTQNIVFARFVLSFSHRRHFHKPRQEVQVQ